VLLVLTTVAKQFIFIPHELRYPLLHDTSHTRNFLVGVIIGLLGPGRKSNEMFRSFDDAYIAYSDQWEDECER
jgi:hypothetical protein